MRTAALVTLLALMSAVAANADDEAWVSVAERSELSFLPRYQGEQLQGRFNEFEVLLTLQAPGGEPGALTVRVAVGAADMQDDEVNAELREPEWFDAAEHPFAEFRSTDIAPNGQGYRARGTLSLRGERRDLELRFRLEADGELRVLSGGVDLARSRWGVGGGEWADDSALAEQVELRYRVVLRPREAGG